MKTHTHHILTAHSVHRLFSPSLFCLILLALWPGVAAAQQIGFRPGSSISAAQINGIQGTKWNDASVLRTGDPGMSSFLPDWDHSPANVMAGHAVPVLTGSVEVFTKRDATHLYIAFRVDDQTRDRRNDPNPGTVVGPIVGERIILQFDADNARGGQLNNDFRIDVTFNWTGGNTVAQFVSQVLADSSGAAGLCPTPIFQPTGSFPSDINIAATSNLTNYFIEFRIPMNRIGNPTNNFGFAFSVINDLGYCDPAGGCDATSISFPSALPVINAANPTFDSLECNWVIPSQWGTAFFSTGLADVSISRMPVWWNSNAITVFACNNAGYTYNPAHPCRVSMQVNLINTGPATTRNLLYLWAEHGSSPSVWHVIDLAKGVAVPAGGGTMPKSGELSDPAIKNKPNHPCVRVYIMPIGFRPDFDEAAIRAISSQAELDTMVLKYGLQDQHNAQKNISREASVPDCPDPACRIARNGILNPTPAVTVATTSSPRSNGQMLFGDFDNSRQRAFTAGSGESRAPRLVNASFEVPIAPPQPGDTRLRSTTGHPILVSSSEAVQFGPKNVIVQVRAFGYSRRNPGSPYNFIEDLGGILHMFPVDVLKERRQMPFELNVSNPGAVERRIVLVFDVYSPSGAFPSVNVTLDDSEKTYAPNETKVARGTVTVGGSSQPPGFRRWGLSLHAGMSFPQGDFNTFFNPGPNAGVDLEYRFNKTFSVEGIYTFHRFNGDTFFGINIPDQNLHQFSVNGKVYGSSSPVRPFFNFGGGAYKFDPGLTRGGLNVGGGLQFDITPNVAFDAMYNFHNVFTSGSNTTFSTVQGGVRFRF